MHSLKSQLILLYMLSPGSGICRLIFLGVISQKAALENKSRQLLGAVTCHQGIEILSPAFITSLFHCW